MPQEHRLGIGAAHQACQRLHGRCSQNRLRVLPGHSQQRINAPCRYIKRACRFGFVSSHNRKGRATGLSCICSQQNAVLGSRSYCSFLTPCIRAFSTHRSGPRYAEVTRCSAGLWTIPVSMFLRMTCLMP